MEREEGEERPAESYLTSGNAGEQEESTFPEPLFDGNRLKGIAV